MKMFRRLRQAASMADTIPLDQLRDHAANETTFLAWLRLSLSISGTGVVLAQFSKMERAVHPDADMRKYHIFGIPQACICQIAAMAYTIIGALRFFANEEALLRGRAKKNGWDLWLAVSLVFVIIGSYIWLLAMTKEMQNGSYA